MGFFKSKKEKEMQKQMEQRMIIKKTINQFNKHIRDLEDQKKKYLESANLAKKEGLNTQYNLALSGLKMAITQQKKAKEMMLNFELASQMKDLTKVTSLFLDGMSMLSTEMARTTKEMDFVKVQSEFETAIMGMEQATDQLDMLMETTNDSYSNVAARDNNIDDTELQEYLAAQTGDDMSNFDNEIEKSLQQLSAGIKE